MTLRPIKLGYMYSFIALKCDMQPTRAFVPVTLIVCPPTERFYCQEAQSGGQMRYSGVIMSAMAFRIISASLTGGFPSKRASDTANVSIWWRHHSVSVHARKSKYVIYTGMLTSLHWQSLANGNIYCLYFWVTRLHAHFCFPVGFDVNFL